jgi:hypothetical protein
MAFILAITSSLMLSAQNKFFFFCSKEICNSKQGAYCIRLSKSAEFNLVVVVTSWEKTKEE